MLAQQRFRQEYLLIARRTNALAFIGVASMQ
jgi:hypothetical protein